MTGKESENLLGIGLRVQKATIGLSSNNHELIQAPEYFGGAPHPAMSRGAGWLIRSQEANCQVERIDYQPAPELDGYFTILDRPGDPPSIDFTERLVTATGDWSALEEATLDRRYSLLGNQGVLFRYMLTVLERKGVFNFHACGLQDRDSGTPYLILGERGSGKSALMLAALDSGRYQAFGTEIVHAGIEAGQLVFFRGCLRNNARVGHLLYDFPGLAEQIGVGFKDLDDPWGTKVQLDFGSFATPEAMIPSKGLVIVVPRIEEELSRAYVTPVRPEQLPKLKRTLLENLSDKIVSMALAYETLPVGSLDTAERLVKRKEFVDFVLENGNIVRAVNLFAGAKNCLEGLSG
jgi:hypothetical protein